MSWRKFFGNISRKELLLYILVLFGALLVVVALGGCVSATRTQRRGHETGTFQGAPYERSWQEEEHSDTESGFSPEVMQGLSQVTSGLLSGDWLKVISGAAIAAAPMLLANRAEKRRGDEHKEDSIEGWGKFEDVVTAKGNTSV